GGVGGVPSTVGVNKGDGVNFYQVGLFDSTNYAYDGSVGLNDGVDFLDYKSIYFDACPNGNTPAIAFDSLCDTIPVYLLVNTNYNFDMLALENGQVLTYSVNHAPSGLTLNQNGSGSSLRIGVNYTPQSLGLDSLVIAFQDNGIPTKTTFYKKYFFSTMTTSVDQNASKNLKIFPNPSNGMLSISGYSAGSIARVFSLQGVKVAEKKLTENETDKLDLSNLAEGVYTIQLTDTRGISVFKKFVLVK
ncbi:MAG: T9SS type A sorting domain-containing protein, partial [Bacteroidia bacterium]|nr:T9SS type A sorting domain-containing protein [Bacteroidia bacterium]